MALFSLLLESCGNRSQCLTVTNGNIDEVCIVIIVYRIVTVMLELQFLTKTIYHE